MRPLAVITGIIAGSCVAITVSLGAVMLIYLILGDDYPRVRYEFRPLLASTLLFLGMTAISAASFYTLLINHRWANVLQVLVWAGVAATAWYYIP
jgi:hypothetical protein